MGKKLDYNRAYNDYWYQLYAYANNILQSREAAEDITQEVFLDLWNRLDDLTIDHYRAYLFKSVKFQCAKRLRNTRFKEVHIEKIESTLELVDSTVGENYEENKTMLLQKIDTIANDLLSERCLLIFKLRFKDNLSYKEIASRLNISPSTVDNQINKALRTLRESCSYESELAILHILLVGISSVCVS